MDKFLKLFDNAPKLSRGIKRVEALTANIPKAADDQPEVTNTDAQKLINCISLFRFTHSIWLRDDYIAEAETYAKANELLKDLYEKPINILYDRNLVATTRQNEGESVDQYV